jgi:hypothetical protein
VPEINEISEIFLLKNEYFSRKNIQTNIPTEKTDDSVKNCIPIPELTCSQIEKIRTAR